MELTKQLAQFGVASEIITRVIARGITSLHPVQREAIEQGMKGINLMVMSPPSSGKTLIGEILGIQRNLMTNKKTVLIFPLKALAREKYLELKRYYQDLLQIQYSSSDLVLTPELFESTDILLATYERWDSYLRNHPHALAQVGVVIVDEIHCVGRPYRGPRLEAMLTRTLDTSEPPQIIGLSATIGNPDSIANWLNAELVYSAEQVPLKYQLLISEDKFSTILKIITKRLLNNQQVLIFCNTRAQTQHLAQKLAKVCHEYIQRENMTTLIEYISTDFLPSIEDPTTPTASTLLNCVSKSGIGFHHAGMSLSERTAIEAAFLNSKLFVLCATPTLAAGMNLPAALVIIKDLKMWDQTWVNANDIHQRAGRAGRSMIDSKGGQVIFLVSDSEELELAEEKYFASTKDSNYEPVPRFDPIRSHLANLDALQEQILTCIVHSGIATKENIADMFKKSLWWTQKREDGINGDHIDGYLFPSQSPHYILQLRGSPERAGINLESTILQITAERVSGLVQHKTGLIKQFSVTFDLNGGVYCSCTKAAKLIKQGMLCQHLTHMASKILQTKTNPFYAPITKILVELNPIHFLITHKLIEELEEEGGYRATIYGRLTIQLYLKSKQMVLIRDSLNHPIKTQKDALRIALRTLQLDNRSSRSTPLEPAVKAMEKWLSGVKQSQILKDSPILYSGDLENLAYGVSWILSAYAKIMRTIGQQFGRYSDELTVLANRMTTGLPESGVVLKKQLGIPRSKAMCLLKGGIRDIEELQTMAPQELLGLKKIMGIGPKTYRIIIRGLSRSVAELPSQSRMKGDHPSPVLEKI